jgi:hypothetical protein
LTQLVRDVQLLLVLLTSLLTTGTIPVHDEGCFARPRSCGYPDATNAGVPPGTHLKPSGSIPVRRNDTTLNGLRISGTVTVAADRVTIENSKLTPPSGGSGSYAVILNAGASHFTIKDSEVVGRAARGRGLQSAVWNHYDNPGALASGVYFHRCSDCWEGGGSFRDSYIVVDAAYPGSHDEDVYVCGGRVRIDHSTLVNRHHQTAAVFGDAGCGGNHIVITRSLLAGGGYLVYPQANSASRTGSMRITDNRFARCKTAPVYDRGSGGWHCAGGADAHGIFPKGGYYGVAAYFYRGRGQIWAGNVWDDDLRPVCPTGTCRRRGSP